MPARNQPASKTDIKGKGCHTYSPDTVQMKQHKEERALKAILANKKRDEILDEGNPFMEKMEKDMKNPFLRVTPEISENSDQDYKPKKRQRSLVGSLDESHSDNPDQHEESKTHLRDASPAGSLEEGSTSRRLEHSWVNVKNGPN